MYQWLFFSWWEGGQKYSELHLLLPLMSAPLLFHPWAHPQLRKLRATPYATSIRYIVTKKKQCERTTNKVPPCYQCQRHVVCQSPKQQQQQQLEPYLAIRLSSAKPAPRTDNPSFTTGLAVTQGVQTPVKRQESPHLLYLPTGLMKKKQNRQCVNLNPLRSVSRLAPAALAGWLVGLVFSHIFSRL